MTMDISQIRIKPAQIATGIEKAWADFVSRPYTPAPHSYVYASSYRECLLQMVRDMVEPDKATPFDTNALANFRRGKDRERDLLADLKKIGRNAEPSFELVGEEQRYELRDRKNRVIIAGKVDARLKFEDRRSAPLEVKAWNVNTVQRIKTFEDLFESRWTRSGAYQLLCYMLGENEEEGYMLLDRNGIPLVLPVVMNDANLERVDKFLQKAVEAVDHVEAGTLPPHTLDSVECRHCPYFARTCDPPTYRNAAALVLDEDLLIKIARRHELGPAAAEYRLLDEAVKDKLRGVDLAVAGEFLIEGNWQKKTTYEMPDDIKSQYRKVEPKGKFSLTITKV